MKRLLSLLTVALLLPAAESAIADPVAELDQRIAAGLKAAGLKPSPRLDDHAFARRAYLAILGRIPRSEELAAFMQDPDRQTLIDELLSHSARVSSDYHFWADLLRITDSIPGVAAGITNYANWLKQALHDNLPYDEMVQALVGAEGFVGENGAVGFYTRDRGMPLDHLANTAQVFLGTRLVCAQCHDHPFEEWSQMDFYKLAAFSAPVEVRSLPSRLAGEMSASYGAYVKPFRNSFVEESGNLLKLPHDYQYDDGAPGDVVTPQTPFGELVDLAPGESRQQAYARWMTGAENPRFARVIANRLWEQAMGVGLTDPVDDLDAGFATGDPALLDFLGALIIDLDFDLIAFRKVLYRSDLFQRQAVAYSTTSGERFHFPGPAHRRLRAEQIWDSIGVLVREDFDDTFTLHRQSEGDRLKLQSYRQLAEARTPAAAGERSQAVQDLMDDALQRAQHSRSEIEALIAANDASGATRWLDELLAENERDLAKLSELAGYGEGSTHAKRVQVPFQTHRLGQAQLARGKFPELRERVVDYFFRHQPHKLDEVREKAERQDRFQAEYDRLLASDGRAGAEAFRLEERYRDSTSHIIRASELGNPSPESHLLRELGQSDRMLIANGRLDTTIPQLLALRNGRLAALMVDPESPLRQRIAESASADEQIASIFLQMITRPPGEHELARLRPEFGSGSDDGIRTTVWALLNSAEFLFSP